LIPLSLAVKTAQDLKVARDHRPEWLRDLTRRTEPDALYYRFLSSLAFSFMSFPGKDNLFAVEIGTYVGVSAAHISYWNGRVLTIDSNPDAKVQVEKLGISRIQAVTSDSMEFAKNLKNYPPIDLLFIDGNHTFTQAYGEYCAYRSFVKDDGLILFDDVALPMATREMEVLWEFIPDPKERCDWLHHTGFGIAQKNPNVTPRPWEAVIGEAQARFTK